MTHTDLDIVMPADEPLIIVRRFLAAPPELVFEAWTQPEHLRHWWGPRRLELVRCEIDLRVGGGYTFVHRAPDGQEFGFHGEYREIDPPHRLVVTFIYDGAPEDESVETSSFEAADGGTIVSSSSRHSSVAARDMHVANGMAEGMTESYERLDERLAAVQTA
jgi:uncharacterized protein YndB with AHSA1/START domain